MAGKLFDWPFQSVILRNIGHVSSCSSEVGIFHIIGDRHEHIHIVSYTFLFVVGFDFYQESYFSLRRLFNNDINREQRFYSNIKTITHELEFSIWGNECNQSLVLKSTQSDTLMEFNIAELNCFIFGGSALCLVVSLIIKTQFQIWHTW